MSVEIIKYDKTLRWERKAKYRPVITVVNQKIYKVNSWGEFFKIILFSYCYKKNNMERVRSDVNISKGYLEYGRIILDSVEETKYYVKFSPELYVHVFPLTYLDCEMLGDVSQYIYPYDLDVYIAKYDSSCLLDEIDNKAEELLEELYLDDNLSIGSTRHLVAHINGKVLSEQEKFYRRIDREFDEKVLIGDIVIDETEEGFLKTYMTEAIKDVAFSGKPIRHEKLFAFGLVKYAQKHYSNKRFWPFFKEEYGVDIPANYQCHVNEKFKEIMLKNDKIYDSSSKDFIQNICMHSFVCDKCADQFFDYMFGFWKIDLSRSIENMYDDDGNDIFDILIDEIAASVQDIMIHTSMALKLNPIGCKNRFRRILRMIDDSFWNKTDFSGSSNKLTMMFNTWKSKRNSAFEKEIKKAAQIREGGRGEKLLSKPTIEYQLQKRAFQLVLPRQILRNCSEQEHPQWTISINDSKECIEPDLFKGKAFLFTEEASTTFSSEFLFDRVELVLASETTKYYSRVLEKTDCRLFSSKLRNVELSGGCAPKDVEYAFVKKGASINCLSGAFSSVYTDMDEYDVYCITPQEGTVLLLPDNQAISIGCPLEEGILESSRVDKAKVIYGDIEYPIVSHPERVFFKANRNKLNGASVKVFNQDKRLHFGKIVDGEYVEFKLDNSLEENYGYVIDMCSYIKEDGLYRFEIDIPGLSIRSYSFCYIHGFDYQFEGAPYVFKEYGKIVFPRHLNVKTSNDWVIDDKKSFEFLLDETSRDACKCVKDGVLTIKYEMNGVEIPITFDLPVFYWKYDVEDRWYTQRPSDVMMKHLPPRIYIRGGFDIASAFVFFSKKDDIEASNIKVNHDTENGLYYFRTVDIASFLNREKMFRELNIKIDNFSTLFFRIVCKSDVRSRSISGDFKNNRIYGYFDIYGDSDYMVTIRYGDELLGEDIPLEDGRFDVECEVKEGRYSIALYEVEDDESGFGSISYELGKYTLDLVDVNRYTGKSLRITKVKYRSRSIADLPLKAEYYIQNMVLTEYEQSKYDEFYSWLYDSGDADQMSNFVYYKGILGFYSHAGKFINLSKVIVVFANEQNTNEVLINTIDDGYLNGLEYSYERGLLQPLKKNLSRYDQKRLRMLDDDIYEINVKINSDGR